MGEKLVAISETPLSYVVADSEEGVAGAHARRAYFQDPPSFRIPLFHVGPARARVIIACHSLAL